MKLKKTGIEFPYHGDTVTRRWPWFDPHGSKYHSKEYSLYFDNFHTYWKHVGISGFLFKEARGSKLQGFTYNEVLAQWVSAKYPYESVVVLKDVNVEERDLSFWAKIPKDSIEHIQKDVIVLRCGSKEKAMEIVLSIEPAFAEAYAYAGGILIDYNQ